MARVALLNERERYCQFNTKGSPRRAFFFQETKLPLFRLAFT